MPQRLSIEISKIKGVCNSVVVRTSKFDTLYGFLMGGKIGIKLQKGRELRNDCLPRNSIRFTMATCTDLYLTLLLFHQIVVSIV